MFPLNPCQAGSSMPKAIISKLDLTERAVTVTPSHYHAVTRVLTDLCRVSKLGVGDRPKTCRTRQRAVEYSRLQMAYPAAINGELLAGRRGLSRLMVADLLFATLDEGKLIANNDWTRRKKR